MFELLAFTNGVLLGARSFCHNIIEIYVVRVLEKNSSKTQSSSLALQKLQRRRHLWR